MTRWLRRSWLALRWRSWRAGARAERAEHEITEEIQLYLDLRADELREAGLDREAAERRASDLFGDRRRVQDRCRHIVATAERRREREELMHDVVSDLRFAARAMRGRPLFTAVAILTLALGIGANSAIFSVVYGILLEPLPYPQPERLVRLFETRPGIPTFPLAPGNVLDYRELDGAFDDLAVYTRFDLQLSADDRPERLAAMRVSAGFFELLGVAPALGRGFERADELSGNERKIVLSDRLWRDRFDADESIVGNVARISAQDFTVVGVMPPGFAHPGGDYRSLPYGEGVDAWWPLTLDPETAHRGAHYTNGIARLRAGVELPQADAALTALSERLEELYPDSNTGWRVRLVPLQDEIVGSSRQLLYLLLGAVGLVLLIACVNVANFLLAHATTRAHEIAVRQALGAERGRLVRQLLTESLLLALGGGAVGLLLTFVGVRALVGLSPEGLPRAHEIGINGPVLLFTLASALGTGLIFGLAPALRASRGDVAQTLTRDARSSGADSGSGRPRSVLAIAQTSIAFVLLAGAGLLLRTFLAIAAADPGFDPRGVLTASVTLPEAAYSTIDEFATFHRELRERLQQSPRILQAGVGSDLPWTGYDENTGFGIVGYDPPEDVRTFARYHFRGPGFFAAVGIPIVAGREFLESDTGDSERVVLINQTAAEAFWTREGGAGQPLGAQVDLWGDTRTVVGIVGSVKDGPRDDEAVPAVYFPHTQQLVSTGDPMYVAVRADGDPLQLAATVRGAVRAIDPALPLAEIRTLDEIGAASRATERFTFVLVSAFAAIAVILAATGIYGVLATMVAERTREIGIRMALGADRRAVLGLVVGQGLALAGAGLTLGGIGALALGRQLGSLLYGVTATDPTTFVSVAVALAVVATVACYAPARRAARLHPVRALRGTRRAGVA